ncbi:MAG: DUF3108 domain-containing protein [Desulfuromonadales bacterium]
MTVRFKTARLLAICIALSLLVHVLTFYAWRLFGTYNFSAAVNRTSSVVVDLEKVAGMDSPTDNSGEEDSEEQEMPDADQAEEEASQSNTATKPAAETTASGSEKPVSSAESKQATNTKIANESHKPIIAAPGISPLGSASNFLSSKSEKFIYQISMFGLPIGNAELEAKNENGEIWITLRVTSNAAISSIYPVYDIIETRHIGGRFIMTKIMQQEGSFRSDEGFTINLGKKRVSWFDNIRGRSQIMAIPTDDVLDTLSSVYYLRNRQLQIGKTETLNIFDSETYAEVPVEILRRETMRLPNLHQVETIVIRPLQKTAGIFRRTGDILIWLTDDDFKVPVKIVTSVAHGTVTIELISAETTPKEDETTKTK